MREPKTSWGGVASWYDSLLEGGENETYQEKVILPNLLRLLDTYKGKRVLDLACGQGYFSRAMYQAGIKVIAADISEELITIARNKSPREIKFHVASADALPFGPEDFDAAVVVLALQNIERAPQALVECARVLRGNGTCLIVMNHPCFRIPRRSGWEFDAKIKLQYRRVDTYLSEDRQAIVMHPGKDTKTATMSFHRPLQYYAKHLHNAGFAISRIEEWTSHKKSEAGPSAALENRARKEFPLFLMIEAVKSTRV